MDNVAVFGNSTNRIRKHAYLIIAHKNDLTFKTLLKLLDDKRNDIFVHMDSKTDGWDPTVAFKDITRASCFAISRIKVAWGGYSQIACELNLLEAAISEGQYAFYHLLSGEDLPIKSQDEIHEFFDEHQGAEFVGFYPRATDWRQRVYGHWLWGRFGCSSSQRVLCHLDTFVSRLDCLLFHRGDRCVYKKGTNWFSIDDSFARYIVSKRAWVEERFRNSFCADEVFLQTVLWNSSFRDRIYQPGGPDVGESIQRLIDWNRGTPYCFTYADFSELRDSPLMFARKFNCMKDGRIVEAVAALVQGEANLN